MRVESSGSENALVFRYLAIPGHAELKPEAMTVVLPMARIDVSVRRAALDRDAGWVPWLRRTVRIEFVSDHGGDYLGPKQVREAFHIPAPPIHKF